MYICSNFKATNTLTLKMGKECIIFFILCNTLAYGTQDFITYYIGCFTDRSPRTLPYNYYQTNSMTIGVCIDHCRQHGFTFAGAQASVQCFCGNKVPLEQKPETDCNRNCGGDSSQMCGGFWRNAVYYTGLNTYYIGCFKDSSEKTLPYNSYSSNSMTIGECMYHCRQLGFNLAGVQYSSICFCGYKIPPEKRPETDCYMACTGDASQMCGGGWRNSVYYTEITIDTDIADPEYAACAKLNGLLLNHNCYYVSKTSDPLEWSQIFSTCAGNGNGYPAQIYSADTSTLVHAWALQINNINEFYWTALKLTKEGSLVKANWMNTIEEAGPVYLGNIPHAVADDDVCVKHRVETSAEYSNSVESEYSLCNASTNGAEVRSLICMEDLRYKADFESTANQRVVLTEFWFLEATKADTNWFCGLSCRRKRGCVSYNYNGKTSECELLGLKSSLYDGNTCVRWGQNDHCFTVVAENSSDWVYNERIN